MDTISLNEVRPRRPEQYSDLDWPVVSELQVSMKSGLEGRNNMCGCVATEVDHIVSMKSGLEGRNNFIGHKCNSITL